MLIYFVIKKNNICIIYLDILEDNKIVVKKKLILEFIFFSEIWKKNWFY